jgi:hypothetical protein
MTWLKSIFSETDGKGSLSRVATALIIVAAIVWVTRLVWHNHALPDFGGLTIFIGAIYGLNLARSAVADIAENKACPPQPKTEATPAA